MSNQSNSSSSNNADNRRETNPDKKRSATINNSLMMMPPPPPRPHYHHPNQQRCIDALRGSSNGYEYTASSDSHNFRKRGPYSLERVHPNHSGSFPSNSRHRQAKSHYPNHSSSRHHNYQYRNDHSAKRHRFHPPLSARQPPHPSKHSTYDSATASTTTRHVDAKTKDIAVERPHHKDCVRFSRVKNEHPRVKQEQGTTSEHSRTKQPETSHCLLDGEDDKNNQQHTNNAPDEPKNTHIIFAIDFSSSMNKKDVRAKKNGRSVKISRWEAVFECISTVLEEQVVAEENSNDVIDLTCDTVVVSVLTFNDEAQTLLDRLPLTGDGHNVRAALDKARKERPRGGTGFSVGFQRARQLAQQDNNYAGNVMLVFLSDGRPGDLKAVPTSPDIPMQTTFRYNRAKYPAAGQHIEAMQQQFGDRFNLQLVCLYAEGKKWLQYLAQRYNGTFHKPILTLDDGDNEGLLGVDEAGSGVKKAATMEGSNEDEDSEDEVVAMVVKSQDTLIRERYNRAVADGNVASLTSMSTAGSTSMRSTFQSISSTVTAMRYSGNRIRERQGVVLAPSSAMIEYEATRMVLDADHEKISMAPGEEANGRKVNVSQHPFAQGGLRNVYRMKQYGEARQVAKESRHDIRYHDRLKFHYETSKCQARAMVYAKQFNKRVKKAKLDVPRIEFLKAEVYRLKDARYPGGFRYLAVEKEMKGQYEKWNNNSGYVNASPSTQSLVAQAFSHFSYEMSNGAEMVVDIQGCGYTYTDPQLHSLDKQFGKADRGSPGYTDFFKSHVCNSYCNALRLADRSMTFGAGHVQIKQESH